MKALSPLAILLSALLLQGCVAAAVVGTAAVGTKAATDPRTVGTQVDDSTLELRVNSALSKDEQIKKQARINVTAYQGKVLLTGQSPTPDLSARAKQIAMGVEGTTEVFNEVRQGQPIGLGTASSDTWITTKVRSQLPEHRSGQILERESNHGKQRSLPDGAGDRPRRPGGGGYCQPGKRRIPGDHRLYLH